MHTIVMYQDYIGIFNHFPAHQWGGGFVVKLGMNRKKSLKKGGGFCYGGLCIWSRLRRGPLSAVGASPLPIRQALVCLCISRISAAAGKLLPRW